MTATYIRDIMRDLDEDLIAESEELMRRISRRSVSGRIRFTAIIAAAVILSMLLTVVGSFAIAQSGLLELIIPRAQEQFIVENSRLLSYVGKANEITIPEGVTSLASDAFDGNKNIRIINLTSEVSEIEIGCFSSCPNLEEVRVPEGSEIVEMGGMIISADGGAVLFVNRADVSRVLNIPEGIHTIDASFYDCDSLTEISLPSTLEEIGARLFADCSSLTDVELGGVISIGGEAFAGCESLKYIDLCGVEVVDDGAFSQSGITYADLGEKVIRINANAFFSCRDMVNVIVPETIEFIHPEAFAYCPIEAVYYEGTAEMWEQIEVNGLKYIENLRLVTDYGKETQIGFVSNGDGTCIVMPSKDRSEEGIVVIPETSPTGEIVVGIEPFRARIGMTGIVLPATITKLPVNAFAECYQLKSVEMPGVTEVGDGAFKFCSMLESIDLSSLDKIGKDAFRGCSKLKNPVFSEDLTEIGESAFRNCKFTEIILPSSVEVLGDYCFADIDELLRVDISICRAIGLTAVFENCTSLSEVKLPASLQYINENTFNNCKSLKSISLPEGLLEIWDGAFGNTSLESIIIPDSVTQLYFPFPNTPSLKEITLGDGIVTLGGIGEGCGVERVNFGANIKTIDAGAFAGCENLVKIDIPKTVAKISKEAFSGCISLKSVSIPYGISELPESCFAGCVALESVELPASLRSIGIKCFNNCTSLSTVEIPSGVGEIPELCFGGCSSLVSVKLPGTLTEIGKSAFINCRSLSSVKLPDGITTISQMAFSGCSALTSVNFPKNLESIGHQAFSDCVSILSIDIPASLKQIEERAFSGCSSVYGLVLPSTLDVLGNQAFAYCSGLKTLTVESPETLEGGTRAFILCTSLESAVFKNSEHFVMPMAMFNGCSSLREVKIENATYEASKYTFSGCTALEDAAFDRLVGMDWYSFENCTGLKEIRFADSLEVVPMMAFNNCTSLKKVICGKNMKTIGSDAFLSCSSLEILELNEGLTTISHGAFEGTSIKELYIPSSVTSVGSAFIDSELESVTVGAGNMRLGYSFENCTSLKEVVFENADGITLQQWVFRGCESLRSIIIREGHLNVSSYCFDGCSSLSDIDFSKIDYIGSYAFRECVSLPSEIVFNNVITYVDYSAFEGCTSIEKVYFGMNMLATSSNIFRGCTSLKEITLGPILANAPGGVNIEKVHYRGTKADFDRLLAANGITFSNAEIIFDADIPLPAGFAYAGDTVNYSGTKFNAEGFTDPVAGTTEDPWDFKAGNMLGDDLYRLAKNEAHSIVYWNGVYYLVMNEDLTVVS